MRKILERWHDAHHGTRYEPPDLDGWYWSSLIPAAVLIGGFLGILFAAYVAGVVYRFIGAVL